ncbi:hypothetical protein DY000_02013284 [Brassica cretica]|uniref:Uncharacterized protein n=1 Tax=Brassica cretica TaxID=69181 RepID=A0ABQ7CUS3_BRACR|nr:hypothetical protein DY000_02013284 [Brassica cretica]
MYLLVVPDLGEKIPRFSMGEVKNNIIRMRNKRGNWERYLAKEGTAISRSVVTISLSFKSEIVKSRWI